MLNKKFIGKTLSQIEFEIKSNENIYFKEVKYNVRIISDSISSLLHIRDYLHKEGFEIIEGIGDITKLTELTKVFEKTKTIDNLIIQDRIKEIINQQSEKYKDENGEYTLFFNPLNENKLVFTWYDFVKKYGTKLVKLSNKLSSNKIVFEISHEDSCINGLLGINYKTNKRNGRVHDIYSEIDVQSSLMGIEKIYELINLLNKIAQNQKELDYLNGKLRVNKYVYELGTGGLEKIIIKYIKRKEIYDRIIEKNE